ncbi:hypothetical protein BBJ29_002794 [Phytophthora kernoviae]|uniref:ACB domain-containing protein n=1 Tax=Phytophthora kernoviae TaxID=325452 RepID=A0A3F2RPE2_9STRA|nr:hypothetical protein BBJ29_002794 [Phytophthora kernoviae]RLN61629.1 hypothetical protein BBP00_00005268 [Phytophthora kernoviae]
MERVFERAAEELKAAGIAGSVSVSDTQKLRLYGLFKQTTIGDCRSSAPSAFRPVETSWNELHGLDATEAKRRYILMVKELLPNFNDEGAMQSQVEQLPDDPDAFQFGDCNSTIPYTLEQTADVYYRKFKEPLPDPASRLLDSITVLEERRLDEYCAVFKRRLVRFRNEAPSLIKRFASSEFVEYIEDSLLDKQNRMFYVYVKNESFQSLGVLEDYSVYQAHTNKAHWAELHQFCRVHITSSSLSFFRSKIESFISNFYCKNAPDARNYHLQRISEEFGEPDKD